MWSAFTLAFNSESGADADTVRYILGRLVGLTVCVNGTDMTVDSIEQDDDPDADYPVFLAGRVYDEAREGHHGERIRVPLAGATVTVY